MTLHLALTVEATHLAVNVYTGNVDLEYTVYVVSNSMMRGTLSSDSSASNPLYDFCDCSIKVRHQCPEWCAGLDE